MLKGVTRGIRELQRLQEITRLRMGSKIVAGGYKGLKGVTGGYRGLLGVEEGYKGLRRVTEG